MDRRKAAVVLLVPLAIFMIVPLSVSTHAVSNGYTLKVECDNYTTTESDSITLTFLGHSVTTSCTPAPDGFGERSFSFASFATGLFHVNSNTAGIPHSALGWLGPTSCYVEGYIYSHSHASWVYFELYSFICEE